jgi:hypothetical protein
MSTALLERTTGTGSSATEHREVAVPITADLSTLLPSQVAVPEASSVAPDDVMIEALTVTIAGLLFIKLAAELLGESALDQAWFWTPGWQAGEAEVSAELAAGLGEVFDNVEDFLADLDH